MIINKDFLKSLSPCQDRWRHYLESYSDWTGTPLEFCDLDKISDEDKIWVLLRESIIPEKQLHLLACDFAESVLHLYEKEYSDDMRPRNVIIAKRRWVNKEITDDELSAARSAARSAAESAAWSAARLAAELAAESAARSAARLAAELAAESAARSAARLAAESAARLAALKSQLEQIKKVLKEVYDN